MARAEQVERVTGMLSLTIELLQLAQHTQPQEGVKAQLGLCQSFKEALESMHTPSTIQQGPMLCTRQGCGHACINRICTQQHFEVMLHLSKLANKMVANSKLKRVSSNMAESVT